jgi:hypothetical protein
MTIGPVIVGVGLVLLSRIEAGDRYASTVLPAMLVLGAGLVVTVAPLTAAVLAAVEQRRAGVGSAINNAVARLAGLLAVAVLPGLAGIVSVSDSSLADHYGRALMIAAALSAIGGVIGWATIRRIES